MPLAAPGNHGRHLELPLVAGRVTENEVGTLDAVVADCVALPVLLHPVDRLVRKVQANKPSPIGFVAELGVVSVNVSYEQLPETPLPVAPWIGDGLDLQIGNLREEEGARDFRLVLDDGAPQEPEPMAKKGIVDGGKLLRLR